MSQDLINLTLSEAQLAAVDNALFELEAQPSGLMALFGLSLSVGGCHR